MTNVITLDSLRAKADEKYAPYQIEMEGGVLTIRNPIRLDKSERERITELKNELNDLYDKSNDEDNEEPIDEDVFHSLMLEMINLCADNKKLASTLNKELRADIGLTQIVFYDWLGDDEVGEASSSAG